MVQINKGYDESPGSFENWLHVVPEFSYDHFQRSSTLMSSKSILFIGIFFASLLIMCSFQTAQAQQSKMYGEIGIATNYVDRGITQSDKGPSLGAGLGYWFGNTGRIGFDAASVKYENEDANVEARIFGEFKFVFSGNSDLRVRNDLVRYFSEDLRNKIMITLDQNFFGYHVLISREDNFEGTRKTRNWFAFHRDWPYGSSYQFNTTVGYSMVEDFDAYFDTRLGASYLTSNLTISLVNTWVSAASQFNGRADTFFFLLIQAKF